MIIDSHVHIWVQQPDRYPWSPVGGYIPKTEAPIEKLLDIMDLNGVDGAVLVQPTPYGWDNRYLLDAAKISPERFRTVCLVDPMSPRNAEDMKRLADQFGANGFRLNWNLHPVKVWMETPAHFTLWETASELNLPVCIQCTLEYIPLLKLMGERFPQVRIVIDHLGRLTTEAGITNTNFQQLLSLSQFSNTFIKFSGFYYCTLQTSPYADLSPFLHAILGSFGVQRCLWGSDFPFIQEHWNYSSFLENIKQIEFCTQEDLGWLLGKTAQNLWW